MYKSNKELKCHVSEIHADTVAIHNFGFCQRPFTKRYNLKRHLMNVHKMGTTNDRLAESAVSVHWDDLHEMKKPVFLLKSDDEFDNFLLDEDEADFEDCGLSDPNEWMKSGEDVDELLGENSFAGDEKVKAASDTIDASDNPRSDLPRINGVELSLLVFYVTCNDIAVMDLLSGSQRHRHFSGFFNLPVLHRHGITVLIR